MKKPKNTKQDILKLLKKIFSGEKIAKILSISRTAAWKHIRDLKRKGYLIKATPKGYSLIDNGDLLNEEELASLLYKVYY